MNCYPKPYEATILIAQRGTETRHTVQVIASTISGALTEAEIMGARLVGEVPESYAPRSFYEITGLRVIV